MKRKFGKMSLVFGLAVVLTVCSGQSFSATAENLRLSDASANDWFQVSATANREGQVEFVWHSDAPNVHLEISDDFGPAVESSASEGATQAEARSNGDKLSFVVSAKRLTARLGTGTDASIPQTEELFLSRLTIDNPVRDFSFFDVPPAQATPLAAKTYLRYQTFIPAEWVEAPRVVCTPDTNNAYVFKGDNRLFDPASANFRTRFQVTVDWTTNGEISSGRYVAVTDRHKLDSNGMPIQPPEETGQASNQGMVLTSVSNSSSLVHYKMSHSVTNPLCDPRFTKPIKYDADVWIARSGPYTINVSMQKVPNHELYIKDSDELNWKPLMQESTFSMLCLMFATPDLVCAGPAFQIPSGDTR